jgi:hypothetical protein
VQVPGVEKLSVLAAELTVQPVAPALEIEYVIDPSPVAEAAAKTGVLLGRNELTVGDQVIVWLILFIVPLIEVGSE